MNVLFMLEKLHPERFFHPGCTPGEIWLCTRTTTDVNLTMRELQLGGFKSVRIGEPFEKKVEGCSELVKCCSIFANKYETARIYEKLKAEGLILSQRNYYYVS
jgi:hypothetical protein